MKFVCIMLKNICIYKYLLWFLIVCRFVNCWLEFSNSDNKSSNRCILGLLNDFCCEVDRWMDNV